MRRKKMAIRIIIVSDTHGKHDLIRDLPESDIFIHSGDFIERYNPHKGAGFTYLEVEW